MSSIQRSTTIDVPAAKVSVFVSDIRNAPSYITSIVATKQLNPLANAGQPTIGASATFAMRFMGGESDLSLRLDEYDPGPPTVITLVSDEQNAVVKLAVTPLGADTSKLDASISAPVAGFMLEMMFGSALSGGLEQVKQLMEQDGQPTDC